MRKLLTFIRRAFGIGTYPALPGSPPPPVLMGGTSSATKCTRLIDVLFVIGGSCLTDDELCRRLERCGYRIIRLDGDVGSHAQR